VDHILNENVRVAKPISYERQMANYLRKARGDETFRSFAKKLGISASSLQRLEQAEQNVTLRMVQQITHRLGVPIRDIFSD
jgi:transcriptional regulator with XRE-family HTH domain